jgi:hypothetical protein
MKNTLYTYNNTTNTVTYVDCYSMYLGNVVSVNTNYRKTPIKGRLVKVSPDSIVLERLDGNLTTIARHAVLSIKNGREWVV